jgi:flagellar assembly protein FliH
MTSLFEFAEAPRMRGTQLPVELIGGGMRGVSLLEFFALEDEAEGEIQAQVAQPGPEAAAQEWARQTAAMVEAARVEAREEARRDYELALAQGIAGERERAERVRLEFAHDRQRYFAAAEAQVVKLALAVARRVLAREVAADAMHLTATVRAALSRVQEGSATVLRVRPDEVSAWAGMLPAEHVTVMGDERVGECVLETEMGRVELGVESQMREVERGFGELMER